MHCTRKNEMARPFLKGVEACDIYSYKCNESLYLENSVCRVISKRGMHEIINV